MKFIIRLLVTAAVAFILAQVLPGVHVAGYDTAIWFAIVLAFLNVFLKPILIILTLPLTLLTFGLFLFIINTITVLLASDWVKGFEIDSFGWGFYSACFLLLSLPFCSAKKTGKEKTNPDFISVPCYFTLNTGISHHVF